MPAPIRDTSSPSTYTQISWELLAVDLQMHAQHEQSTETLADFTRCTTALMATTGGCLADRPRRKGLVCGFGSSLQGPAALVKSIENACGFDMHRHVVLASAQEHVVYQPAEGERK